VDNILGFHYSYVFLDEIILAGEFAYDEKWRMMKSSLRHSMPTSEMPVVLICPWRMKWYILCFILCECLCEGWNDSFFASSWVDQSSLMESSFHYPFHHYTSSSLLSFLISEKMMESLVDQRERLSLQDYDKHLNFNIINFQILASNIIIHFGSSPGKDELDIMKAKLVRFMCRRWLPTSKLKLLETEMAHHLFCTSFSPKCRENESLIQMPLGMRL
jgi:hypothetical protein